MVRGKGGWLRIMEASIAVLLIASVLLVIYSKQVTTQSHTNRQLDNLAEKAILDIQTNQTLRNAVLANETGPLNVYLNKLIPGVISHHVRICNLTSGSATPCKIIEASVSSSIGERSVYTKEAIIASNSTQYGPLKVKLFLWEI